MSLEVLQGTGAPVLEFVPLLPVGRLFCLLVIFLSLLLGIVIVVVAAAVAAAVIVVRLRVLLLLLLWIVGSYHRFPESFGGHNIHSTAKRKKLVKGIFSRV